MWSVVASTTLEILLWVIQAWQDCHKASRSMQCGMLLVISFLPHIVAYHQESPSDHPIDDPDVAHLP